jgi:formamidopyrimidine-DNA glycosylase
VIIQSAVLPKNFRAGVNYFAIHLVSVPELPDITVYLEALSSRILNQRLERVRLNTPFLLRTTDPPISAAEGAAVIELQRVGKRIAIGLDNGIWLVLHLMIAGRLHWKSPAARLGGKNALAAFDFRHGTLTLTEAGSQRRASLHVVRDPTVLDPGGIEVLFSTESEFARALTQENHTLKRSLADPHVFSGIGNAYSDEILHAARISPVALTQSLRPEEILRLHRAVIDTLNLWISRLRDEAKRSFPEHVTAFREGMAVHGRYGQPCPVCQTKVQRIRYAANETNYCPHCQTGGKLLADRSLSRLLKKDWPRTPEALEELKLK